MTVAETITLLQSTFPSAITGSNAEAADRYVTVEISQLRDVCSFLKHDPRMNFALLNNISGVDYLETDPKKLAKAGFEPHLEVVYHFSSFAVPGRRLTLKVMLPRWKGGVTGELPEVPTISDLWRTADWHEREVYDLLGIRFTGHPDLRRILMNDDWIGHPLRKDYEMPLEYHYIRCR
ncbi:hypothetical protein BH11PLA2_BH11PLA2_18400 [soil metagenome]